MSDASSRPVWLTLIPVLFIILLLGVAVFGEKGILCAINSNQQKEQLQQRVQELEADNQHLREEIKALHSDRRYLEALARKQLGMVKPGERVYQFRSQPPATLPEPARKIVAETPHQPH